jgi:hypothetical protein
MDPTGTETVRWAYPPLPASATNARHRLAAQLVTWKIGESETEPLFLIAYELMANAIEHARTPFELAVCFNGIVVVVDVRDESTLQPRLQPVDVHAARGRGLQMVATMAKSWSCVQHADSKTVRAVITLQH